MILPAAIQLYDVVVSLHILAVVIGLGPIFVYALLARVAASEGAAASLAVERAMLRWNETGATAGMVVILLSGIYLVVDRWGFGDTFVSWGLVVIVALFGMVHGYFVPRERRLIAMLEEDAAAAASDRPVPSVPGGGGPVATLAAAPATDDLRERPDELAAINREMAQMSMVAATLIVVTIILMTTKPLL